MKSRVNARPPLRSNKGCRHSLIDGLIQSANADSLYGLQVHLSVKLSVMLACLLGVIICMGRVTVRRKCMMGDLFMRIHLVILGRFAMMLVQPHSLLEPMEVEVGRPDGRQDDL